MKGLPQIVGRLAPSPTGAQHVGNARTYLLAWLAARSNGGRVILRIEDIDSPRIKPGAARQALEDLTWIGLDWDEGPDLSGPSAPYIQTERLASYRSALAKLIDADQVYPCTCTRSDIELAASAPHIEHEGKVFRYPETCRHRQACDGRNLQPGTFSWRLRTSHGLKTLNDLCAGQKSCDVRKELGDFVIAKSDGTPSYQLAVACDDAAMGVNQVVRGNDLLPSTFRQWELAEWFGWPKPQYAHVPLVVGPDGRRLAKRHGDTRLASLREMGIPAETLVGWLGFSAGLIDKPVPCQPRELISRFAWDKIPATPCTFEPGML